MTTFIAASNEFVGGCKDKVGKTNAVPRFIDRAPSRAIEKRAAACIR
jgi:hypothetical protein